MRTIKERVISYLNIGLNPTVIGFDDDGLVYLLDDLLNGVENSNSYDPTFTFVHVNLRYIEKLTVQAVECEINNNLSRDSFPGDNIYETCESEVEVVCVVDDLPFVDDIIKAVEVCDILIRKYRGKLRFVYLVEDPLFIDKIKTLIPPSSSIFEALIYQIVGESWEEGAFAKVHEERFRAHLDVDVLNKVSQSSNNHYGLFKRLYQDEVLGTNSTKRYIQMLINNFDTKVLNTFKKVVKGYELTPQEEDIKEAYEKVGFIKNSRITIPLLSEAIENTIVKSKIDVNEKAGLVGLDLNLLTPAERKIVEELLVTEETVTKDTIANLIWENKSAEKYSDWAIDQRVARLRRKLMDLGFNIDIRTIYGKGYKLIKL